MLHATNVVFRINNALILNNITLKLETGTVTGLLGQNGAGKTTLLSILAGIVAPSDGDVCLDNASIFKNAACKKNIGYLPDSAPLHDNFTVLEQLEYAARLFLVKPSLHQGAVQTAIEQCNLGDIQKRLTGQLSRGQRQRVGIAQAIVHKPAVLIVDEPTEGLDPVQVQSFRVLIKDLASTTAVIVSSHQINEVEQSCDRVTILADGRLVSHQHMNQTTQQIKLVFAKPVDDSLLANCDGVSQITTVEPSTYILSTADTEKTGQALIALCASHKLPLIEMISGHSNLHDSFFQTHSNAEPLA